MQDYSSSGEPRKNLHPSIGFVYIIPLGLVVGFFLFALLYVLEGNSLTVPNVALTPNVSPTAPAQLSPVPTSTPAPSPTPASKIAKTDVSIIVQNGSGLSGVAGKAATLLRDDGFTKVTTGNASKFTYTNITMQYTSEGKDKAELVKKTLEKNYTIKTIEEGSATQKADVLVIVGKVTTNDEP